MAQHDYVIANDTAANVRADINNALAAVVSNNSGATQPTTMYANEWWYDTATDTLKIRAEANDAWISVALLNQTTDQAFPVVGGVTVTSTGTELNLLDGSVAGTIVNSKAVVYGAAGQVNATTLQIAGTSITATAAEINFVAGVTSAIQTQLNAKAALASPALTGTPTAPTAAVGTNTTQVATTAFVNAEIANDVDVRSGYVSSDQTITSAGLLTLAHSLGQAPKIINLYLVCATAEAGWAIGDVILVSNNNTSTAENRHTAAYFDATNVYIRFASATSCFTVANKGTGAPVVVTNANFRLRVRAFA